MKKWVVCLFVLLLVLAVTACGNGDNGAEVTLPPVGTEEDQPYDDAEDEEDEADETDESAEPEPSELELVDLVLFDHDLTDSVFLEPHVLTGPSGAAYTVSVIAGGRETTAVPSRLYWETETIIMYAELWYDTEGLWFDDVDDARGLVASRLMEDMAWLGSLTETGGISLDIHIPFHVSADGQSAFVGFGTDFMGDFLLFFYFAQVIPDSDYILGMELMLNLNFLTWDDVDALEELSQHMGFDFLVYLW